MSIPFTQYKLPDGRKQEVFFSTTPEIEAQAQRFIKAGGRYECEILTTGEVSLTAEINNLYDDDESPHMCIQICKNGPDVIKKVEELVKNSVEYLHLIANPLG